jgi:FkbM family methyltransferase
MNLIRRLASHLPKGAQHELRRMNFARQIRRDEFIPREPEIDAIRTLVKDGDWVIDIGANVGHYTLELSRQVGATGRVLAFEPVPQTFEILAANVVASKAGNVSLLNMAASNVAGVFSMQIPTFEETNLDNYYQARLCDSGGLTVLCSPVDSIPIPHRIRLIKIDAEGHDLSVLEGMQALIERDRPVLIVESAEGGAIPDWLKQRGYSISKAANSPNIIALPTNAAQA